MSEDQFDRFIRTSLPPVDLSADRVQRLSDAVFARLEALPTQQKTQALPTQQKTQALPTQQKTQALPTRQKTAQRLGGGFTGWMDLLGRFAVPMATAAALGLVVGAEMMPSDAGSAHIADLFAPTYLSPGH